MYQNKVHSVENRIVSISQPWIRQIVRGKTKAPVDFEKISYEAYNESKCCYRQGFIRTKLYDMTLINSVICISDEFYSGMNTFYSD